MFICAKIVCGSQFVFNFEIIFYQKRAFLQPRTKNPHKYCHLEIIYCFTMTQKRNNIKRIFITNPHNFLPQPHYSNFFVRYHRPPKMNH